MSMSHTMEQQQQQRRVATLVAHLRNEDASDASLVDTGCLHLKARVFHNGLAVMTLARATAYNALTLPMVESMLRLLQQWDGDERVRAVMLTAEGGRAFCAGGDIKAIANAAALSSSSSSSSSSPSDADIDGKREPYAFFSVEYQLDHLTQRLSKPYVSFLHAITFGGGCGITMHGSVRVCCEQTKIAMPECAIGLVCDVGGSHFLTRWPGECGMYCALTAHRLNAADALYTGAATHFVPLQDFGSCQQRMQACDLRSREARVVLLETLQQSSSSHQPSNSFLQHNREHIDALFSPQRSYQELEDRLRHHAQQSNDRGRFAASTLRTMSAMSPTSLHLTFMTLRAGQTASLAECLKLEYRVVSRLSLLARQGDFFEGVRAKVIDKDEKPLWKALPPPERLAWYLSPLPKDQELSLPQ